MQHRDDESKIYIFCQVYHRMYSGVMRKTGREGTPCPNT